MSAKRTVIVSSPRSSIFSYVTSPTGGETRVLSRTVHERALKAANQTLEKMIEAKRKTGATQDAVAERYVAERQKV